MKKTSFQDCIKVKTYLEKWNHSESLETIGFQRLIGIIKLETNIDVGIKALNNIVDSIGINRTRSAKKENDNSNIEIEVLKDEVSKLNTVIKDLTSVVNHLVKEVTETKNHAYASRQYVNDLADQLGVTFEQYNHVLSNGRL